MMKPTGICQYVGMVLLFPNMRYLCFRIVFLDIMGVEGGIRFVKYLLFFFNLIFWVSSSFLVLIIFLISERLCFPDMVCV